MTARSLYPDYLLNTAALTTNYCPVDLIISTNTTACSYQASQNLSTSGLLELEGDITFQAGNSITLQPAGRQVLRALSDEKRIAS